CFLLESAEQGQVGRYSFVGLRPRAVLRWSDGELSEWSGRAATLGGEPSKVESEPDPYGAVAARFAGYRPAPGPDLPPFTRGAVGFFGYDLVRTVEPLGPPHPHEPGLPAIALMGTHPMPVFAPPRPAPTPPPLCP